MSMGLFEPYRVGNLELGNRFIRSATYDGMADSSGAVTDASVKLYQELGRGGVGLIVSGYAFISPLGQAVPCQYGAHSDDMIPGLRRLVQAAHQGSAKIALQIFHAGINSPYLSAIGSTTLAVSAIPGLNIPHREITEDEIENIIADFAAAALRGKEAGFDAIELHSAHGYLMSQFLSPIFNRRTDQWGGSAENRRRFNLETIRKVRQAIGTDFPLMMKLGVEEDREGGLSLDEGIAAAQQMVKQGLDAIEVSTGRGDDITIGIPPKKKGDPERAYFRDRAAALKRAVNIPVGVVAGIRSLEMANDIVDSGDADLISMCRPFIREPDLVARWQRGEVKAAKCISCNQCVNIIANGEPLECGEERRIRKELTANN